MRIKQRISRRLENCAICIEIYEWGWRPFIGWGLGVALIWQVLIAPAITFWINVFGYYPTLPTLNSDWISVVLIPMLSLSAMHSFDKLQSSKSSDKIENEGADNQSAPSLSQSHENVKQN